MSYALGSDFVRSQKGLSVKKDEMYYIPLLSSLQQFLSNRAILDEVVLMISSIILFSFDRLKIAIRKVVTQ